MRATADWTVYGSCERPQTGQSTVHASDRRLDSLRYIRLAGLPYEANSFHWVSIEHGKLKRELRRFNSVAQINNGHLIELDPFRRSKHSIA